jgi:hypothetical protein
MSLETLDLRSMSPCISEGTGIDPISRYKDTDTRPSPETNRAYIHPRSPPRTTACRDHLSLSTCTYRNTLVLGDKDQYTQPNTGNTLSLPTPSRGRCQRCYTAHTSIYELHTSRRSIRLRSVNPISIDNEVSQASLTSHVQLPGTKQ